MALWGLVTGAALCFERFILSLARLSPAQPWYSFMLMGLRTLAQRRLGLNPLGSRVRLLHAEMIWQVESGTVLTYAQAAQLIAKDNGAGQILSVHESGDNAGTVAVSGSGCINHRGRGNREVVELAFP